MNRAKELFRSYKFRYVYWVDYCGLSFTSIDCDVYVLQD